MAARQRRAVLTSVAALVMAAVGVAVAALAPQAFTDDQPGAATWWLAAGGAVGALLCVTVALLNLAFSPARRAEGAKLVVLLGWVSIAALMVAGWMLMAAGLDGVDALGLGFVVAIPSGFAVLLGLLTRAQAQQAPVGA